MPIAINGSGTITGISAGGLPDDCITTAEIAANAVTYAKIGTTEQGQLCKAWVNFNGTGTVAIRAQYNVSSITDNGVGDYTVNFTAALADANYAIVNGKDNSLASTSYGYWTTQSQATSNFRMHHTVISSGSTFGDAPICMFAVFR
jgi:hypothetical protein